MINLKIIIKNKVFNICIKKHLKLIFKKIDFNWKSIIFVLYNIFSSSIIQKKLKKKKKKNRHFLMYIKKL